METYGVSIKGIYRDRLRDSNGRIIYDSGWVSNTIVDGCRKLLAAFMKNDPSSGIQFLAVGQGKAKWDDEPEPCPKDTPELTSQYDGPPISGSDLTIAYLKADDRPTAEEATTRLRITAILGKDYPTSESYPLREFGLFAEMDGTPILINCIRHPVIHKVGDSILERKIFLSFEENQMTKT